VLPGRLCVSVILDGMDSFGLVVVSDAPPVLTPKQAARALHVSDGTIRRWMRSGQLEGVRIGGRLRVPVEALEDFPRPASDRTVVGA
jgi:excisionase family DNA binding protein